jgi:hypothetical protein
MMTVSRCYSKHGRVMNNQSTAGKWRRTTNKNNKNKNVYQVAMRGFPANAFGFGTVPENAFGGTANANTFGGVNVPPPPKAQENGNINESYFSDSYDYFSDQPGVPIPNTKKPKNAKEYHKETNNVGGYTTPIFFQKNTGLNTISPHQQVSYYSDSYSFYSQDPKTRLPTVKPHNMLGVVDVAQPEKAIKQDLKIVATGRAMGVLNDFFTNVNKNEQNKPKNTSKVNSIVRKCDDVLKQTMQNNKMHAQFNEDLQKRLNQYKEEEDKSVSLL